MELRKKKDGTLKSKYWYGSYVVNGKRHVKSLGVEVAGTPPKSLRDLGDALFELSRGEAKERLKQYVADARGTKTSESLVQSLHEIKYGNKIESFPIADLVKAWEAMPKKRRTLNARYAKDVKRTIERFVEYMARTHPKLEDTAQVDRKIAREFMVAEEERGVADKTWNDTLKRVRAVFRFLATEYGLWRNPFDGIRMREETQYHRRPLTEAQIAKLLEVAEEDDFCRPLIVCGLSTAMRLGDCCTLKWENVDLNSPTPSITIKTSKTGETVCIPVYDRLQVELEKARSDRRRSKVYVWPEQAKLYKRQHSMVSQKLRSLFNKAVGKGNVHVKREHGLHKASVIDFHSLRTTWITVALSRGVPIETVKLISGHKTVEVVTTHYFHPNGDQVRDALQGALPEALTGTTTTDQGTRPIGVVLAEARGLLESVTDKKHSDTIAKAVGLISEAEAIAAGELRALPAPAA